MKVENHLLLCNRKWNVEKGKRTRTWPDWWPTCRREWSELRFVKAIRC